MRGETTNHEVFAFTDFISIHSPHARGDAAAYAGCRADLRISIHSPLTRGDLDGRAYELRFDNIQSTPLMRGETARLSIPSSRAINFNPLPSYEERLDEADHLYGWDVFQSTPLMRGETQNQIAALQGMTFQSDPLMRGETTAIDRLRAFEPFQSTPLMRGETIDDEETIVGGEFQSTPLMRGETKRRAERRALIPISIHSPHARGDMVMYTPRT